MPLTLWTEHGVGHRSPAFFARIAKSLANTSKSCAYVVPNELHRRHAETLCMASDAGIFFGNRIVTTANWIAQLAQCKTSVLSPAARNQKITQLLSHLTLNYFSVASHTSGTTDLIAAGITAALAAGIRPQELLLLAQDYGQEREQDLALVYDAYLKKLVDDRVTDSAQLTGLAIDRVHANAPLGYERLIVESGISPTPQLWKLLRTLGSINSLDLHVIVPEMHCHRAETVLGQQAHEISDGEWVANSPAPMQLFRAPNPTAEYRWMATHMRRKEVALIANDPDTTLWLAHCMDVGLIPQKALPLTLAASPISIPWGDPARWRHGPSAASLSEWTAFWAQQLYPASKIRELGNAIATDVTAARALRHIAQWELLWTRATALYDASTSFTAAELCAIIDPLLQSTKEPELGPFPYASLSSEYCLGNFLPEICILDASQDLFPKLTASPFFRRAALFPQDPVAERLRDAFPGSDDLLRHHLAAWQRLRGTATTVTAIFSATHASLGDQSQSMMLDATPIDIPTPAVAAKPLLPDTPADATLLRDPDTIADVKHRMRDHVFSITELETFADCPFRHFARYILGINVPDEDTAEIPPHHEGQIIHRLLENYYREGSKKTLQEILTTTIATTEPLRQIQIDRILLVATQATSWDSEQPSRLGPDALTPIHMEWKFGSNDVPPLVLQDEEAPIKIRGTVDRIDMNAAQKRLVLMDYKYKRQEVKSILADIRNGLHLQIPLYILAAQAAFPDYQILGGLLFDLNALHRHYGLAHKAEGEFLGIRSTLKSLLKDEAWDETLATAEAFAAQYARQIRQGLFPVSPHTCEYCDWKGII